MKLIQATLLLFALLFQKPGAPVVRTSASAAPLIHSVSLKWTPSTTPGVSYIVYRCINGTGCSLTGSGWLKLNPAYFYGTTFNDNSVTPGTAYYYRVTSYNGLESLPTPILLMRVPGP